MLHNKKGIISHTLYDLVTPPVFQSFTVEWYGPLVITVSQFKIVKQ